MKKYPLFFTHIPKTAGTSFLWGVLYENYNNSEILEPKGIRELMKLYNDEVRIIREHLPFGMHLFIRKKPKYYTILRNPVERGISHYYFVKNSENHHYKSIHERYTLKQFFNKSKIQRYRFISHSHLIDNMQTRFIAGLGNNFYGRNSKIMLDKAKKNLEKYFPIIGIKERFNDSVKLFINYYNLHDFREIYKKTTQNKPVLESLDDDTREILFENHKLDIQLYEFAIERFNALISNSKKRV